MRWPRNTRARVDRWTMPDLHITAHALQRARERIPGIGSEEQARGILASATIARAAAFGAHYVRLGTGQHVVIRDRAVITVLPKEAPLWRLGYFAYHDGGNSKAREGVSAAQ